MYKMNYLACDYEMIDYINIGNQYSCPIQNFLIKKIY